MEAFMNELIELRNKNIELVLRVRKLEALLKPNLEFIIELPRKEHCLLEMLLANKILTKDKIMQVLYYDTDIIDNVIESHISKLRKKLRAYGITISNQRYLGYSISSNARQILVKA